MTLLDCYINVSNAVNYIFYTIDCLYGSMLEITKPWFTRNSEQRSDRRLGRFWSYLYRRDRQKHRAFMYTCYQFVLLRLCLASQEYPQNHDRLLDRVVQGVGVTVVQNSTSRIQCSVDSPASPHMSTGQQMEPVMVENVPWSTTSFLLRLCSSRVWFVY